jgi:hypothetical protein
MITDKTARTSSYKAIEAASSLKSQAGNVVRLLPSFLSRGFSSALG